MEGSTYMAYVLLTYLVVVYIYGVVTYFNLKNKCSKLRNTGAPGQFCVSPESRTSRCWNSGNELHCSHCIFGFKSAVSGGHVCKSNRDVSEDVSSLSECRYALQDQLPKINIVKPDELSVNVEYATDTDYQLPTEDNKTNILTTLKKNCFYDLKISSQVPVKTKCENVTKDGDGICRKDYDTFVTSQKIRYRPELNQDPELTITQET